MTAQADTVTVKRIDARQAALVEHITAVWRHRELYRAVVEISGYALATAPDAFLDRAESNAHRRVDELVRDRLVIDRQVSWWADPGGQFTAPGDAQRRVMSSTAPVAEVLDWIRLDRDQLRQAGVQQRRPEAYWMVIGVVEATVIPYPGGGADRG